MVFGPAQYPPAQFSLFNKTPSVGGLPTFSDYFLFRRGVQPSWEDPANEKGGRWVAILDESFKPHHQQQFPNPSSPTASQVDAYWMAVVRSVVGAQYGSVNEEVCGVVASLRPKQNRVCLLVQTLEWVLLILMGVFRWLCGSGTPVRSRRSACSAPCSRRRSTPCPAPTLR